MLVAPIKGFVTIKLGVTGTRNQLTNSQVNNLTRYMTSIVTNYDPDIVFELHHGDCVGADVMTAILCKSLGMKIVCHPPIKDELRAFHKSDEFRPPLSYFARNRNIVNESALLMVLPKDNEHKNFGGTWYTHDYAVKVKKPITIFYPDGRIETKNHPE